MCALIGAQGGLRVCAQDVKRRSLSEAEQHAIRARTQVVKYADENRDSISLWL